MSLWLDCSGSYTGVPTARQVEDLRSLGFEGAIVGTSWSRAVALAQLKAFEAGGMRVEEYQFPSAIRPPEKAWWIDAELADATLAALRVALSNGASGVYSRRGWALENQPAWDCRAEFPQAQLWDARYVHGGGRCVIAETVARAGDVRAAIAIERSLLTPFVPYWGFEAAKITQWHNSVTIAGVNMDLNEYEEDDVPAPTIEEFRALFGHVLQIGNSVNAIAEAFFDHVRDHDAGGEGVQAQRIEAAIDELDERLKQAAAALDG